MLLALVEDLSEFADVVYPLDPRFEDVIDAGRVTAIPVHNQGPLWSQWATAAKSCDAAIVVAPEYDGLLAQAVAMLRAGGVKVIAGSGDFLRTASDKALTARAWWNAGVTHPMYLTMADRRFEAELRSHSRFVVKPRDGCGTLEIRTFDRFDDATRHLKDSSILQTWCEGRAVSIAVIASRAGLTFLPAVSQTLDSKTCEYAGGCGPLDDEDQRRSTAIASRAIAAMPPTVRGFVGLDLLLAEGHSEDCIIEINPRLTTSYVGLRKMVHGNLAARLLEVESGPVACSTTMNTVSWTPDGTVRLNDVRVGTA